MIGTAEGLRAKRLQSARREMETAAVDLLLVGPSADLYYLTGYSRPASERPTLLAVSKDATFLLLPAFEAPLAGSTFESDDLLTYGETENPLDLLQRSRSDPRKIAISDQCWASLLLALQEAFPEASFVPAGPLLRFLRMSKSSAEIDLLARAGAIVDAVFERITSAEFAGRSERELARELDELVLAEGLEAPIWSIVASGPNSASPHHVPTDRVMQEGEAVLLDFGGALQGYQADTTRTVHVGEPDAEFRRIYDTARQAQEAGVRAVKPGAEAQAVDRATRAVINEAGFGEFFIHRTGHGIGLETHEEPYIVAGNGLALEPGMTFSVEPGIYLPGRFGVRIEDIVAVTQNGARQLNNARRDLVTVH